MESADYLRTAIVAALCAPAPVRGTKGRRETFVPRRQTHSHGLPIGRYLLQHSEPQHPFCSAFTSAVGHSSTQQTQVQRVHSQRSVSQQPQQSHDPQPAFRLLVVGTKGTRASTAKRIRLFMIGILFSGTLNRSLRVTTCERGKATAHVHPRRWTHAHGREDTDQWPIQFRQTP